MLVLTREPGQSLAIGEAVEVAVLSVRGDQVKLGIIAPRDVIVLRTELLESAEDAELSPWAS